MTDTTRAEAAHRVGGERLGVLLVSLSALCWSLGGALVRFVDNPDSWTIIFWRASWSVAFLVAFMLWRDGLRGSIRAFRDMGIAGVFVAVGVAISSTAFVIAIAYTTVANVLFIQAGIPLVAALLAWLVFGEKVAPATWAAIAAVILGVGIMVSRSLTGAVSPIGDGLALTITIAFACVTVITRRYAHVRMTPAVLLGMALAAIIAFTQAGDLSVSTHDMVFLFVLGTVNLGLGLAFFAYGARLIPAALAALLGTLEPVLGPIWVWLAHGEVPSAQTIAGGAVVCTALVVHLLRELREQTRPGRPGTTGLPAPK